MSHNGLATNVVVANVSDPSPQMTATMRAGHFAPTVSSITPNAGNRPLVVAISDVGGTGFVHGATFLLRDSYMTEYPASTSAWIGKTRLAGSLDLSGLPDGHYDVVVRNPDGQEAVLADGFTVNGPDGQEAVLADGFTVNGTVPVLIHDLCAQIVGATVELTWDIWSDEVVQGYRILRREAGTAIDVVINPSLIEPGVRRYVDDDIRPGAGYEYVLVAVLNDGSELRSLPESVKTVGYALELYQNEPNPFNPSTRIRYSLPQRAHVRLDVFDPMGRRISTLVDEVRDAGPNEALWNGTSDSGGTVASGVYFYRIRTGRRVLTKKLLLLK
jgi:hypothetical protein